MTVSFRPCGWKDPRTTCFALMATETSLTRLPLPFAARYQVRVSLPLGMAAKWKVAQTEAAFLSCAPLCPCGCAEEGAIDDAFGRGCQPRARGSRLDIRRGGLERHSVGARDERGWH